MFPMTYASFSKEGVEHGLSLVWASSSNRLLSVLGGEGYDSWLGVDATLAINRLVQDEWVEETRGTVEGK